MENELKIILKEALKIQGDLFPDEQEETIDDVIHLYKKCNDIEKKHLFDIEKEGLQLTKKLGHLNRNFDKTGEIKSHLENVDKVYGPILKKYDE